MPPLAGASSLPPATDLQATWTFLKEGIEIMMSKHTEGLEYPRYMNLYTVAYNYCISSRMNTSADRGVGGAGKAGADLEGVGLYEHLKRYFQDRCSTIEEVRRQRRAVTLSNFEADNLCTRARRARDRFHTKHC